MVSCELGDHVSRFPESPAGYTLLFTSDDILKSKVQFLEGMKIGYVVDHPSIRKDVEILRVHKDPEDGKVELSFASEDPLIDRNSVLAETWERMSAA